MIVNYEQQFLECYQVLQLDGHTEQKAAQLCNFFECLDDVKYKKERVRISAFITHV